MSKGATELYNLLIQEYPHLKIRKEVSLKIEFSGKTLNLYVDFMIPSLKLAFEFDGIQHSEFNAFFHKSQSNFVHSQIRDSLKTEALEHLGLTLIRFSDKDELSIPLLRERTKQAVDAKKD